nr:hypothetical protein [Tanacetum cinerariifolium]
MKMNLTQLCHLDQMNDDNNILARKDQLRRTIILEDVHLNAVFDAWSNKFAKLHDERESMGHVVKILQLCKVK